MGTGSSSGNTLFTQGSLSSQPFYPAQGMSQQQFVPTQTQEPEVHGSNSGPPMGDKEQQQQNSPNRGNQLPSSQGQNIMQFNAQTVNLIQYCGPNNHPQSS